MTKLNRLCKIIIPAILSVLLLVGMMAPAAWAYEKVDTSRDATLTVVMADADVRIQGVQFRAYKIADVDEVGVFSIAAAYDKYKVELPQVKSDYRNLAETLQAYIARDEVEPDRVAFTDATGVANFGTVEKGMYLILTDMFQTDEKIYTVDPSIAAVPTSEDGDTWIYDVNVVTKFTSEDIPDERISINVMKVWEGETEEVIATYRPNSISAELIANGEKIDEVVLSAQNNWRHTWTDLDPTVEYNVTEKEIVDPNLVFPYRVQITRDGQTITLRNIYENPEIPRTPGEEPTPPKKTPPTIPNTGQNWMPAIIMGGLGILLLAIGALRKRNA